MLKTVWNIITCTQCAIKLIMNKLKLSLKQAFNFNTDKDTEISVLTNLCSLRHLVFCAKSTNKPWCLSCSSLSKQHAVWICQQLVYFSIHRAVILNGHRWNYCLIILGTEWEGWASSPSAIKVSIFEQSSFGLGYRCCHGLLSSNDGGMHPVFAHCCHNLHTVGAVLGASCHPTTLWSPALWNTTYL